MISLESESVRIGVSGSTAVILAKAGIQTTKKYYTICVENCGYEASLVVRRIYEALNDRKAEKHHQVRVVDESGEDYLYPEKYFAPARLPSETKEKLELIKA